MLIIALVAVLAVAGGGGAVWYAQHSHTDASEGSGPEKPSATIVHLDGFTVNLADPEENHFLRVTIDLALERVPTPVDRTKPNSGLPVAQMRDSILSVLTVCKADELLTSEGKLRLKKNLLAALNRDNPELGVQEIYFTEFLVQR
jgi:flagellar basal body-associated protein FliL